MWRGLFAPHVPQPPIKEASVPHVPSHPDGVALRCRRCLGSASGRRRENPLQTRPEQGVRGSHSERADRHQSRRQGRLQGEEARHAQCLRRSRQHAASPTIKEEGFQNKIANAARRGDGRQGESIPGDPSSSAASRDRPSMPDMCDVMIDMPANYGSLLTTFADLPHDLRAGLPQRQRPRLNRPRRSGAQESEDRRVPDVRHARGSRQRGIVDNVSLQTSDP